MDSEDSGFSYSLRKPVSFYGFRGFRKSYSLRKPVSFYGFRGFRIQLQL